MTRGWSTDGGLPGFWLPDEKVETLYGEFTVVSPANS